MKIPSLAAAAISALAIVPAHADEGHPYALPMSGAQFMSLCANPPNDNGPQVVAMCRMYVAGIADGMKASGQICFGSWLSQHDLYKASAWWIETRAYETRPVAVMVKNGLLNSFPCARRRNVVYGPPADYRLKQAETAVRFMTLAKELLFIFGVK